MKLTPCFCDLAIGMRKVSTEEVARIAKLARLKLEGGELESLTTDFNQILDYFSELTQVDLTDTEPVSHVLNKTNATRPDIATESLDNASREKLSEYFKNHYFVVPKVIQEG